MKNKVEDLKEPLLEAGAANILSDEVLEQRICTLIMKGLEQKDKESYDQTITRGIIDIAQAMGCTKEDVLRVDKMERMTYLQERITKIENKINIICASKGINGEVGGFSKFIEAVPLLNTIAFVFEGFETNGSKANKRLRVSIMLKYTGELLNEGLKRAVAMMGNLQKTIDKLQETVDNLSLRCEESERKHEQERIKHEQERKTNRIIRIKQAVEKVWLRKKSKQEKIENKKMMNLLLGLSQSLGINPNCIDTENVSTRSSINFDSTMNYGGKRGDVTRLPANLAQSKSISQSTFNSINGGLLPIGEVDDVTVQMRKGSDKTEVTEYPENDSTWMSRIKDEKESSKLNISDYSTIG